MADLSGIAWSTQVSHVPVRDYNHASQGTPASFTCMSAKQMVSASCAGGSTQEDDVLKPYSWPDMHSQIINAALNGSEVSDFQSTGSYPG
jgi:hypothetical protein